MKAVRDAAGCPWVDAMSKGDLDVMLAQGSGSVTGGVRVLLRVEGVCILAAAILAYRQFGLGWGTFALWFLAPDLSFLGYLAGPRVGAAVYNAAHAYVGALACLAAGALLGPPEWTWLGAAGMIWAAHVGMDRACGFGLKYAVGFRATHLGLMGRGAADR